MENLSQRMKKAASEIDATLAAILDAKTVPGRLCDAMAYASLGGGKRLRGFLCLQGAALFAPTSGHILHLAAAIEAVHSYSLVHDDLPSMDDDDMRRGKPSLHRAFDEATAILAGDALLTLGFEIVSSPEISSNAAVTARLTQSLAAAIGARGMVQGQMLDIYARGEAATPDALLAQIHARKTGDLIAFAAASGAIWAGAEREAEQALWEYGRALGLAFQIADDVLDVTADPHILGKTTGKDEAQNKLTYVELYGLDEAKNMAAEAVGQACASLAWFGESAEILKALAQFVITRES
jgi:farnesyl diphosphate synthase